MKCIKCGMDIQDNESKCPNCNHEIINEENNIESSNVDNTTNIDESLALSSVDNSNTVKPKKKKKLLGLIILILFFVILGTGFFLYEYKSGEIKINSIVDKLFSYTEDVQVANYKENSSDFNLSINLNDSQNKLKLTLDGTSNIDINNKMVDMKINLNELNFDENLINEPLKIELLLKDSRFNLLLENFYKKYIYFESEYIDEYFEQLKKDDTNYQVIISELKTAVKDAIKATDYKQKIKTVNLNGKNTKVNSLSIKLNNKNNNIIKKSMLTSIKNNDKLLDEILKSINTQYTDEKISKEELKNQLESEIKNIDEQSNNDSSDDDSIIEIYTPLFSNSLSGLSIISKTERYNFDSEKDENIIQELVLSIEDDKYNFIYKENEKELAKVDLLYETKEKNIKYSINGYANIYEQKYEFSIDFNMNNKNTSDIKIDTSNSIKYEDLTVKDIKEIYNKIINFGELGAYIKDLYDINTMLDGLDDNMTISKLMY